jgi:DNA (cytosine-5)-methyltransferase 1
MNAIELFAGVGGFRIGLERAGHTVIWANEWDKYACDVYDQNLQGEKIDRRDITTVPAGDIPAHDLICGGFPCQAFSTAGKRRGFADIRGTLFFDVARIAEHHDCGRTFGTILRILDGLGYDVQWQVLNSKDFGVPQNRERVIIIGNHRSRPRPEVFPLAQETADAGRIRFLGHTSLSGSQSSKLYGLDGLSPTLTTKTTQVMDQGGVRFLTPLECERLQGFPDDWTAGVSDTQRYKMMGNAVTTNVIEVVARRLPV